METPIDQLPWPQIQIVAAALLNWLVTQGWKIAVPSKPINPVLVSSIVGAIIGAVVVGIQGGQSPEHILWALFVAVTSVFGGSGIHAARSIRRAVKAVAEEPVEHGDSETEECPAP